MEASERILFIDDDAPVRTAFARSLKGHGFAIDLADGFEKAVEMVKQGGYAVIASDYRMPQMNGLELIERIRAEQPDATFMLVSGECDLDLALEAVNDHSVSYVIPKPWDTEELASVLRRSIESHWEKVGTRKIQRSIVDTSRSLEDQKTRLEMAVSASENLMAELLLNTLQLRGHETRAHCRRVAAYARLMAEAMNVNGHELASIQQGALLHDIGTIGIPDAVLHKEGALTAEDWQALRSHVELGGRLLEGFDALSGARQVVLQHHERFDGTGYPNKLAGERICLGARIFAVADALDAILSDRPYRRAATIDTAVAEITRCSGTHFDPTVVDAFRSIPREKWVEVRIQHPDEPSDVAKVA